MKKLVLAAAAIIALASSNAQAYDRNTVLFGLGVDNLRNSTSDGNNGGIRAGEVRAQFIGKSFNNVAGITGISPIFGAEADAKGAAYVYGGFLYDWNFYGNWSLVPNLALGAYHKGNGKDLGGWFEFHDSIGLEYKLDPNSRAGLYLTHISNASIYDHNPGKEDLMATYSLSY